jgi:nucleotide-binding universal stress UspA family protein
MRILLAADGSKYTKKALAYLVANDGFAANGGEIVVLHVQAPMPPRVKTLVGAGAVSGYQREEAAKVLGPIERFLARHGSAFKCRWVVGHASDEILRAAEKEKAEMIVMGTHGHGIVGRALMGSVAQKVLVEAKVPVLLVK